MSDVDDQSPSDALALLSSISEASLAKIFDFAIDYTDTLPKSGPVHIGNDQKLRMYGYYKAGRFGPCTTDKPGILDPVGRWKWDAWQQMSPLSSSEAMRRYVAEIFTIIDAIDETELSADDQQRRAQFLDTITQAAQEEPDSSPLRGAPSRAVQQTPAQLRFQPRTSPDTNDAMSPIQEEQHTAQSDQEPPLQSESSDSPSSVDKSSSAAGDGTSPARPIRIEFDEAKTPAGELSSSSSSKPEAKSSSVVPLSAEQKLVALLEEQLDHADENDYDDDEVQSRAQFRAELRWIVQKLRERIDKKETIFHETQSRWESKLTTLEQSHMRLLKQMNDLRTQNTVLQAKQPVTVTKTVQAPRSAFDRFSRAFTILSLMGGGGFAAYHAARRIQQQLKL